MLSSSRRLSALLTKSTFTANLDLLPCFAVNASRVNLLSEPVEFHNWLLEGIRRAQKRIFLTALYLGKDETHFIQAIDKALAQNNELEFWYLADYLRSTREAPDATCSVDLLAVLKSKYKQRVSIGFYHTPELTGWKKKLVPKRFDEGWGLWHSKIYGFDDDVLISGANLSNDYFTNRQDRYMVLSNCSPLADYLHKFITIGQSISYHLTPHSSFPVWPKAGNLVPEPIISSQVSEHKNVSQELFKKLQSDALVSANPSSHSPGDVEVRPFLQMGHLDIREETDYVLPFLLGLGKKRGVGRIDWTSGYFSLDQVNQRRLLDAQVDQVRVVCAAPEANGFFQSAGVSKYIPPAYTLAEHRFYDEAVQRDKGESVQLSEWKRAGWTYHAKGIWLSSTDTPDQPFATIIGSSNYGPRSATRDVELSVLVSTTNSSLRRRLGEEVDHIRRHTEPVNQDTFTRPDRRIGMGVRVAAYMIRDML